MSKDSKIEFHENRFQIIKENWENSKFGKYPPTATNLRKFFHELVHFKTPNESVVHSIRYLLKFSSNEVIFNSEKLKSNNQFKWIEKFFREQTNPSHERLDALYNVMCAGLGISFPDLQLQNDKLQNIKAKQGKTKNRNANSLQADYYCLMSEYQTNDIKIAYLKIELQADDTYTIKFKHHLLYTGEAEQNGPFIWCRLVSQSDKKHYVLLLLDVGTDTFVKNLYPGIIIMQTFQSHSNMQSVFVVLYRNGGPLANFDQLKVKDSRAVPGIKYDEFHDLFLYSYPSLINVTPPKRIEDFIQNRDYFYTYYQGIFFMNKPQATQMQIWLKVSDDFGIIHCKIITNQDELLEYKGKGIFYNGNKQWLHASLCSDSGAHMSFISRLPNSIKDTMFRGVINLQEAFNSEKIITSPFLLKASNKDNFANLELLNDNTFTPKFIHDGLKRAHSIDISAQKINFQTDSDFNNAFNKILGRYQLNYLSTDKLVIHECPLVIENDFSVSLKTPNSKYIGTLLYKSESKIWMIDLNNISSKNYIKFLFRYNPDNVSITGMMFGNKTERLFNIRFFMFKNPNFHNVSSFEIEAQDIKSRLLKDFTQEMEYLADTNAQDFALTTNATLKLKEVLQLYQNANKPDKNVKYTYALYHIHDDETKLALSILKMYDDNTAIVDNRLSASDTHEYSGFWEKNDDFYVFKLSQSSNQEGRKSVKTLCMNFQISDHTDEIIIGMWHNMNNAPVVVGGIAMLQKLKNENKYEPKVFKTKDSIKVVPEEIRTFFKYKSQNLLRTPNDTNSLKKLKKFINRHASNFKGTGQYIYEHDIFISCPINSEKNPEKLTKLKAFVEQLVSEFETKEFGNRKFENVFAPILKKTQNSAIGEDFTKNLINSRMQIAIFTESISAGVAFEIAWFIKSGKPSIIFSPKDKDSILPTMLLKINDLDNTNFKVLHYEKFDDILEHLNGSAVIKILENEFFK